MIYVQRLTVSGCEDDLVRDYFEWAHDASRGEPEWDAATLAVRHEIAQRGYDIYEGLSLPNITDDEIRPLEAYASAGVNSRVTPQDVARYVARAGDAKPLLSKLPPDLPLEDATDAHLSTAASLIELFTQAAGIKLAKATKFLYKKRPLLIPMIDRNVQHFMLINFPHRVALASSTLDLLMLYREILRKRSESLHAIRSGLASQGFSLSPARILSALVWLKWQMFAKPYAPEGSSVVCDTSSSKRVEVMCLNVWGVNSLAEAKSSANEMWNGA